MQRHYDRFYPLITPYFTNVEPLQKMLIIIDKQDTRFNE